LGINMKREYHNRWYDKYPGLHLLLEKLESLEKRERDRIIIYVKDLIIDHDKKLFDKYVFELPVSKRRRWYDKNHFSWLVVNSLKYAEEDLITDITLFLQEAV
jgi:hypothetical protein